MASLLWLTIFSLTILLSAARERKDAEFRPHLSSVNRGVHGTWSEEYAYVDVREHAHMFYWLQYTTHQDGYTNRPLVFWHQGGPGASSSGYGNYEIIGPEDIHGNYNDDTWLQSVSIVYLDSPVGSGFSYVDNNASFARDLQQMSDDLVTFSRVFFEEHVDLQNVPLYIFGESYGGKVAAGFGQALHQAVDAGDVTCNLQGYVMGDAWTSPMDSVNTWGSYLHEMSVLDEVGLAAVEKAAEDTQRACDEGRWFWCSLEWGRTEMVIWEHSNYVSFYNILEYEIVSETGVTFNRAGRQVHSTRRFPHLGIAYDTMLAPYQSDNLYDFMNNEVREMVGVVPEHVTWAGQSGLVFDFNRGDFMKDCLDIIDDTLNNTNLQVVIYQGQLDLICDTTGAMLWTQRLRWPGLSDYNNATRHALTEPLDGQTDMYVKAQGNFKFYWNLRAGHMVPADMGPAALRMLERIIGDVDR